MDSVFDPFRCLTFSHISLAGYHLARFGRLVQASPALDVGYSIAKTGVGSKTVRWVGSCRSF